MQKTQTIEGFCLVYGAKVITPSRVDRPNPYGGFPQLFSRKPTNKMADPGVANFLTDWFSQLIIDLYPPSLVFESIKRLP